MKLEALQIFVCPSCKSNLGLSNAVLDAAEVIEGQLSCEGCQQTYPIVRGVPRFVQSGEYAASFGRQWNWFRTVQIDSLSGDDESQRTLKECSGWTEADVRGRLILDAGAGAGRFAACIAAQGGHIVGVDLTSAIDAAYANIGRHPNVHLAQADIFALPFRPRTFDLAYSIGVLHHTPDPATAFQRVADKVKPGGQFAVYLYSDYGGWCRASDLLRTVTTRLPAPLMLALSTAAVPLYFVYKVPVIGRLLQVAAPISMHPRWRWRWLDTFDWYTPKYQFKYLYPEICRWYRAAGFRDLEVFDGPIRMRGEKPLPQDTPHESRASQTPLELVAAR
jgi:SAM-dependent methyltransferase